MIATFSQCVVNWYKIMGPKLVIRDAIIISAKGLVVMQVKNLKIILVN